MLHTSWDDQEKVVLHGWHCVRNKNRANKLRKRGEDIRWSMTYDCWIWDFKNRRVVR